MLGCCYRCETSWQTMEGTFGRGKVPTEIDLFEWAKTVEDRGAGKILFTSMDHDGTKNGFANIALALLSQSRQIPIIASGGAGYISHFSDTFIHGKADAALAASVISEKYSSQTHVLKDNQHSYDYDPTQF